MYSESNSQPPTKIFLIFIHHCHLFKKEKKNYEHKLNGTALVPMFLQIRR